MRALALLAALLIPLGLLFSVNGLGADSTANRDTLTGVDRARHMIARGEQLDTIPKAIWRQLLTPEQYRVLWEGGTEKSGSGALLNNTAKGVYVTAGCRLPVFHSDHKYESGSGWPSFWEIYQADNIVLKPDWSWGMRRTEVLSSCGEHLGHVFDDGPPPTGLRYCLNSLALDFVSEE